MRRIIPLALVVQARFLSCPAEWSEEWTVQFEEQLIRAIASDENAVMRVQPNSPCFPALSPVRCKDLAIPGLKRCQALLYMPHNMPYHGTMEVSQDLPSGEKKKCFVTFTKELQANGRKYKIRHKNWRLNCKTFWPLLPKPTSKPSQPPATKPEFTTKTTTTTTSQKESTNRVCSINCGVGSCVRGFDGDYCLCPLNYYYSQSAGTCIEQCSLDCGTGTCAKIASEFLCLCASGQRFNPISETCELTTTTKRKTTTTITTTTTTMTTTKTKAASATPATTISETEHYSSSTESFSSEEDCPAGKHFDAAYGKCVWGAVNPTSRPESATPATTTSSTKASSSTESVVLTTTDVLTVGNDTQVCADGEVEMIVDDDSDLDYISYECVPLSEVEPTLQTQTETNMPIENTSSECDPFTSDCDYDLVEISSSTTDASADFSKTTVVIETEKESEAPASTELTKTSTTRSSTTSSSTKTNAFTTKNAIVKTTKSTTTTTTITTTTTTPTTVTMPSKSPIKDVTTPAETQTSSEELIDDCFLDCGVGTCRIDEFGASCACPEKTDFYSLFRNTCISLKPDEPLLSPTVTVTETVTVTTTIPTTSATATPTSSRSLKAEGDSETEWNLCNCSTGMRSAKWCNSVEEYIKECYDECDETQLAQCEGSGSGDFLGSDDEEEFMDGFYTASSERGLTPDGDLSSLALFSYQEDEVEDDMLPSLISEDESDLFIDPKDMFVFEEDDDEELVNDDPMSLVDSELQLKTTRGPPTFTKWSSWSKCSKTCGTGLQRRRRSCVDVRNCDRTSLHAVRECENLPCFDNFF